MLFLFQDCKLLTKQNKIISTNLAYKSRQVSSQVPSRFHPRVRVQQQRHMTETRDNCQDVHNVTQLEMSLTVCIKTRSPSASLPSITVKWPIQMSEKKEKLTNSKWI